jgi:hypothetical protein
VNQQLCRTLRQRARIDTVGMPLVSYDRGRGGMRICVAASTRGFYLELKKLVRRHS